MILLAGAGPTTRHAAEEFVNIMYIQHLHIIVLLV
jgi:hypothetical protein